jgi:riboflavin biosynthesis pyrimidine reductase
MQTSMSTEQSIQYLREHYRANPVKFEFVSKLMVSGGPMVNVSLLEAETFYELIKELESISQP